jgi:predicted anti-sigma-YlaC factor YlaD
MMSLAFDGDDSPDEQRLLREHLAECGDCAAEWRALQAVDRLLVQVRPVEPPAMLVSHVMQGVTRHRQHHARLRLGARLLYALLGLLTLAAAPVLIVVALVRDNPLIAELFAGLWTHLVALVGALAGAVAILLRAAVGEQVIMIALCSAFLALLLMYGSLRLLGATRSNGLGA